MQTVSLCDIIDIEITQENDIVIECDQTGIPLDERNIAYKAAKLFFDKANINSGVKITIKKNIPMAAGLAGGSADGAAVLVGLNELFDAILSNSDIYALGAALGADVPFCISCGCCYTEGIGEKLTDIDPLLPETVLVIACGGEGVSTPMAYGMLDSKYNKFVDYIPRGCDELKSTLKLGGSDFYKYIFNIFEEPVSNVRTAVGLAKEIMLDNGACASMMSGSGPSVFGIFVNTEDAEMAVAELKANGYFAVVAFPTGKRKA
jgi:4-diphosphocytidyl-2-C-methyl-D-erythritol kinase